MRGGRRPNLTAGSRPQGSHHLLYGISRYQSFPHKDGQRVQGINTARSIIAHGVLNASGDPHETPS